MESNRFFELLVDFTTVVYNSTELLRKLVHIEGVTPQQYKILELIFLNESESVTAICDCLDLSMPNASREIKKLSQMGYVKKVPHEEDKRKMLIFLTEKGLIEMQTAFEKLQKLFKEAMTGISTEEEEQIIGEMIHLKNSLFKKLGS